MGWTSRNFPKSGKVATPTGKSRPTRIEKPNTPLHFCELPVVFRPLLSTRHRASLTVVVVSADLAARTTLDNIYYGRHRGICRGCVAERRWRVSVVTVTAALQVVSIETTFWTPLESVHHRRCRRHHRICRNYLPGHRWRAYTVTVLDVFVVIVVLGYH